LSSVEWIGFAGVAGYIAAASVGLVASVLVSADASAWAKARCFFFWVPAWLSGPVFCFVFVWIYFPALGDLAVREATSSGEILSFYY
jgi:hypothetical protein